MSAGWYGSMDRKKVPKIVVTDGGVGGVLDGNKTNAQVYEYTDGRGVSSPVGGGGGPRRPFEMYI